MLNERNSVSSFLRSCFEHNQSALGSLKRECCLPREWHRYLGSGMQNPWLKLTLAAVLLTFLGCSKQEEHKPKAPPIKVMAIRAERGDLAKRLHVSGPLKFIANTTSWPSLFFHRARPFLRKWLHRSSRLRSLMDKP